MTFKKYHSICDKIEMSLKSFKFYFHFSTWLYTSFAKLHSTTDPIEIIDQLIPKVQAFEGLQNE